MWGPHTQKGAGRCGVPWPVRALLCCPPTSTASSDVTQPELRRPVGAPGSMEQGVPCAGHLGGGLSPGGGVGVTELTVSVEFSSTPGHLPLVCLCLMFAKGTGVLRVWKCLGESCARSEGPPPPCPALPAPVSVRGTCPALSNSTSTEDVFHILGVLGGGQDRALGPAQHLSN